ncbi:MAG: CRTAC1 family protein [Verrucomicrobiales bacterium]|nr:CRTAC1 family protein [Verrucomicrobiales bacterium]
MTLTTPGRRFLRGVTRLGALGWIALFGVGTVALLLVLRRSPVVETPGDAVTTESTPTGSRAISPETAQALAALEAREQSVAETLWAPELRAQACGRVLDRLWNAVKDTARSNRLATLATLSAAEWVLPQFVEPSPLGHGIEVYQAERGAVAISPGAWRSRVAGWISDGWEMPQIELRHVGFSPAADGTTARSDYQVAVHLVHPESGAAVALEGRVIVDWDLAHEDGGGVPITRIDARGMTLQRRVDAPAFREVLHEFVQPGANTSSIDPLLVQDLDGDGRSEVVLASQNRVYRIQADGSWAGSPLCTHEPGLISTALFADVDGDAVLDLLVMRHEGLRVCRGEPGGGFSRPWEKAWDPPAPLAYPMAMTGGDIDGDGDVDLYVAQYKVPYELGLMPVPFDDARDGHRSVLLLNEGRGQFRDATEAAGLESHARRRSYAASLVDLDADHRLDLVLVSDFAGIDVLRGDGRGGFQDVTADWIPERRAFGMGHAVSDFNADGRVDVLMTGMTSATASRLEQLDLWREGLGTDRASRRAMAHGNRLYLARAAGGFHERSSELGIDASGWSWGCAALDADNDGYPEVYVANGLESRQSVEDYESHYWMHDAFVGGIQEDPVAYLYFMGKFSRTRGRGQSYGGYDKNRFFLNRGGRGFENVAHLFGVAYEEDSRNVVADDLDGDGRVDLVVTGFESWPQSKQSLRFLRNELAQTGNWVGFRLAEGGVGAATLGARLELRHGDRRSVRVVTSGDSYRSQQAAVAHFGLGTATRVDEVRVVWPGGREVVIREPELNRYHRVARPGATVDR